MLLERERERLLAVLQGRTSSHAERVQARRALEADLAPDEEHEASAQEDGDRSPAQPPEDDD